MDKIFAVALGLTGAGIVVAPTKLYSEKLSAQLFNWATEPNPPGQATQGWIGTDLDSALKIAAGYLVLVSIGLLLRKKEDGKVNATLDTLVKGVQMIYNLAQCFLCSYMIWGAMNHAVENRYTFTCNNFDVTETGMAAVTHIFFLSKILDFFDTIFIVLRQKWRQFSFLHIYHHVSIFLVYWMNINVGYDGDVYLTVVLNSFVHLVMYSYYFLSTLGYRAPWKNYITLLQMGQFILMNIQAIYILVNGCPYPRNITWFYLIYIISLFALFQNFYTKTYTKPKQAEGGKKKSQ